MTSSRALSVTRYGRSSTVIAAMAIAFASLVFAFDTEARGGSGWSFTRTEACLMKKVNQARSNRGLPRLVWDEQLGYVARRHANTMAQYRSVWHDGSVGSKVTRWYSLGQNTGRSLNCRRMFRNFWNSSTHRYNMLGRWSFMGVGVRWVNGVVYVQHIFESSRDPSNVWSWPRS